jgi:hypothetical protein
LGSEMCIRDRYYLPAYVAEKAFWGYLNAPPQGCSGEAWRPSILRWWSAIGHPAKSLIFEGHVEFGEIDLEIFGASLKSILKLSWRYFYNFRHFSVEMSWCRVLRVHVSTIHRGGVHSLEFHQDNPNPSYLWIRRLSQKQQFNRSIWYPLVN